MTEVFGCVKSTIRLRSGLYFDLADPRPEQFTLKDIAGALSKICRFGGQIEANFYSVAEHSVHCARQAEIDGQSIAVQRVALMHDAAEALIGDVVKPLKMLLPEYGLIERRVEDVINAKYGLADSDAADWDAVKEIDHAMLIAERKALFSRDGVEWTGENTVRRIYPAIRRWQPTTAETAFLLTAAALGVSDK